MFSPIFIFFKRLLNKSPFPGKNIEEIISYNRACNFNFEKDDYKILEKDGKQFNEINIILN